MVRDTIDGLAGRCGVVVIFLVMAVAAHATAASGEVDAFVLEARMTKVAPKLDGMLDDSAWRRAVPIHVAIHQPATMQRTGDTVVQLRAVRTSDDIYIAARWSDPTQSIQKEQWTYDGLQWRRGRDVDEDRLALIFPIGNSAPWFAESGCALTCHVRRRNPLTLDTEPKWYKGTLAQSQRLDVWHWKSVRSNPMGYADDKYWVFASPTGQRKNGGRYADGNEGGPNPASKNVAADGKRPAYMQDPRKRPSMPGVLLNDEKVAFDESRFKPGDTIPGRVLTAPTGSRADVQCVGEYRGTSWHLEMRRSLNTGHNDDVVFRPGERVPFALAIFENVSERRKQDHGKAQDRLVLSLPVP